MVLRLSVEHGHALREELHLLLLLFLSRVWELHHERVELTELLVQMTHLLAYWISLHESLQALLLHY